MVKLTELNEIADFKVELLDRFGKLPVEVSNLLLKIMLRVLAIKAGVKRLDLIGQQFSLHFSGAHQKNPAGIFKMLDSKKYRFEFTREQVLKANLEKASATGLQTQVKNILKEIMQRVNN